MCIISVWQHGQFGRLLVSGGCRPCLDAVIIEDVATRLRSDLSLQRIPADWALGSGTFRSWLSV